jgi:excisionase family DNA binding protein
LKLLSTKECGERKGVTAMTVLNAINRGDLAFIRQGRSFKIKEEVCDKWEPVDFSTAGKRGAQKRWEGHTVEEKPKRPRGRPKKNTEDVTK